MKRGDIEIRTWREAAAGYTAVWALENTRALDLGRDEAAARPTPPAARA